MAKATQTYYILVRHTAYSVNRESQFEKGLEQRSVKLNDKKIELLNQKGIPFYTDWSKADEAVETYCYPKNYKGMTPIANGQFLTIKSISSEEIFKPYSTPAY